MIAFLLPIFARLGLPPGFQRIAAWVTTFVAVIALVGLLWAIHGHFERTVYNQAYNDGWNALKAKDEAEAAKARKVNDAAVAKADTERATDTAVINTDKEARDVAIKSAPASATGAATRAANCVRWARTHSGSTARPAGC